MIMISIHVEAVEGIKLRRLVIAESKVDCHLKLDHAASENIVQETMLLLVSKIFYLEKRFMHFVYLHFNLWLLSQLF